MKTLISTWCSELLCSPALARPDSDVQQQDELSVLIFVDLIWEDFKAHVGSSAL